MMSDWDAQSDQDEEQETDERNEDDSDEEDEDEKDEEEEKERVRVLLAEVQQLRSQFDEKSSAWQSAIMPNSLNISEALQQVLQLTELVAEICPKDRETYWKREEEFTKGTVDAAFEQFRAASHAAYSTITAKESQLEAEQATVGKHFALAQDLIGRMDTLEKTSESLLGYMKTLESNSEETLQERQESKDNAMSAFQAAQEEAERTMEKIRRKHEVNSNIFTGLADWFSREDDQFDLALSLGINEDAEREKDRQIIAYHEGVLRDDIKSFQAAEEALEDVRGLLNDLHIAQETIRSTSESMQAMKTQTTTTSRELIKRKDALQQVATKLSDIENTMQNIDEETRLPTIGQMSTEILYVLEAAAKYQGFEDGLKNLNQKIWALLEKNDNWQASFDEDEELEQRYREVEKMLT